MDKNEILEKSRLENSGKDLADMEAINKASKYAFIVFAVVSGVFAIYGEIVYNLRFILNMWFISLFVSEAVMFFVKYFYIRKKHELIIAIMYSVFFIISLGLTILWMML